EATALHDPCRVQRSLLGALHVTQKPIRALEPARQCLGRSLAVSIVVGPEDVSASKASDESDERKYRRDAQQVLDHRCDLLANPPIAAVPRSDRAAGASRLLSSVRRELVRPKLAPDLPDLVARLLALRIGGEQMPLGPVLEHLQRLDRGLLEQADGGQVDLVIVAKRGRRFQRATAGLSPAIRHQGLPIPLLETRPSP